jgi:hypothetical protein
MEGRLTKVETRLETLIPLLATKADVFEAKADIVKWVAGTALGSVAIVVSVMAFMLNRIAPLPNAQPMPQPAVVVIPSLQHVAPATPAG